MFIKPLALTMSLVLSLNLIDFSNGSFSNMVQNPIILDMDFSTDVDDAVAVRMATALDDMDVCSLVAVGLCTTSDDGSDRNLKAVHGLLSHDGYAEVPIGKAHISEPDKSPYWDVCAEYSTTEFNVKDSVDLYKEVLRSCYNKVTIVTTGYLTNIRYLLEDQEGYNLVKENCERIVVTGGTFPSGWDNNFGFTANAAEAINVVENRCPVQIVYVPNDVGGKFTAGGLIQDLSPDDVLSKALSAFGTSDGRAAWDPTAVYIAAVPEEASNFRFIPISAEFEENGSHVFKEVSNSTLPQETPLPSESPSTEVSATPIESVDVEGYASSVNNEIKTVTPEDMFEKSIDDNNYESTPSPIIQEQKPFRVAVRYEDGVSAEQYQDMIEGIISYEYLR